MVPHCQKGICWRMILLQLFLGFLFLQAYPRGIGHYKIGFSSLVTVNPKTTPDKCRTQTISYSSDSFAWEVVVTINVKILNTIAVIEILSRCRDTVISLDIF